MRIHPLLVTGLFFAVATISSAPASLAGSRPAAGVMAAQAAPLDEMSAAKRKRRPSSAEAYGSSGTQIACTRFGCQPIPRGCQIVGERTWGGTPTGFDAVVCPYR